MPTFTSQRGISLLMWEAGRNGIFIYLLWKYFVVVCNQTVCFACTFWRSQRQISVIKKEKSNTLKMEKCMRTLLSSAPPHILPYPPPHTPPWYRGASFLSPCLLPFPLPPLSRAHPPSPSFWTSSYGLCSVISFSFLETIWDCPDYLASYPWQSALKSQIFVS